MGPRYRTYRGAVFILRGDDIHGNEEEIISIFRCKGHEKRPLPVYGNNELRGRSVAPVSRKTPPSPSTNTNLLLVLKNAYIHRYIYT